MQETPVQLLGWEDPLEKIQAQYSWASLAAQLIKKKNPPTMRKTWVQSLGWEDPLEKLPTPAFALLHSVLQSQTCRLSQVSFDFLLLHFSSLWWCWRRKWQPTLVFLPGEYHGQRTLAGCSPWDCKDLDTTERFSLTSLPMMKIGSFLGVSSKDVTSNIFFWC